METERGIIGISDSVRMPILDEQIPPWFTRNSFPLAEPPPEVEAEDEAGDGRFHHRGTEVTENGTIMFPSSSVTSVSLW